MEEEDNTSIEDVKRCVTQRRMEEVDNTNMEEQPSGTKRRGVEDYSPREGLSGAKQRKTEDKTTNTEGETCEASFIVNKQVYNYGQVGNLSTGDGNSGNMEATFCQQQQDKQQQEIAAELEEWTRGMVESSAFKKVMEKLNQGITWITIKGSPGEGKTTVAKMAPRELQKSDRQVFQVRSPEDFTEATKTSSRPVILLDDVFGDLEFDHSAWMRWKDVFHTVLDVKEHRSHEQGMNTTVKNTVTVLLVGRDYVLKGAAVHMGKLYKVITEDSHVINMSHSIQRSLGEKKSIWDAIVGTSGIHVPQQVVECIITLDGGHGFPHVCRLFVTIHRDKPQISPEQFFQTPLAFLNETVKLFLENDNKLMLFQQMILKEGKLSERDLECVDMEHKLKVKQQAKELLGTYLRMEDGCFVFDHPSIYDSVAFSLCNLHTLFVIKNCDLSFLHERLQLEPLPHTEYGLVKSEMDLVVYISQSYAGDLAKRFAHEISQGHFWFVLSHQACTKEMFIKKMMPQITIPLTQVVKLTNRKLHFEFDFNFPSGGEHFLELIASNKSPQLLKYIDNYIQLTQTDINIVLYGVCKYAASDILTYLNQSHHTTDINIKYRYMKQTPIMLAAKTGESKFVDQILSLDHDLYACDLSGETVLHYMCKYSHVTAIQHLINRGVDIDMGTDINNPTHGRTLSSYAGSSSPLRSACQYDEPEVVRLLLDKGAKIDINTIYEACDCGDTDIMKMLFKRNASLDRLSFDMKLIFYAACIRGEIDVIRYLVEEGASVNIGDGEESPLHTVCTSFTNTRTVQCLLELGADINSSDKSGYTPLHTAAESGSNKCIDTLLTAGADVNVQSKDGYTPIHKAAESGSEECVDILLKAGADVNVQSKDGYTPLHEASVNFNNTFEDLFDDGLDNYSPDISIFQTLIRHGADINQQDTERNTPLHLLCHVNSDTKVWRNMYVKPASFYRPLVTLFVDSGADVNIVNNRWEPALCGWCKTLLQV